MEEAIAAVQKQKFHVAKHQTEFAMLNIREAFETL
jgi:hypothetical protein